MSCWKLGDRQAYLLRLLPLALHLRNLGHQVLFAVHEVQAGAGELGPSSFRVDRWGIIEAVDLCPSSS